MLRGEVSRVVLGRVIMYRTVPRGAPYDVGRPWPSRHGRFDDGRRATLYVSSTPEGAAAEFFRRHSELLEHQSHSRLEMWRLTLNVLAECLDVRTEAQAALAGITVEALRSSDFDESKRYEECRRLAAETESVGFVGIIYPSAALDDDKTWNACLFGDPAPMRWFQQGADQVARPHVDRSLVRILETE